MRSLRRIFKIKMFLVSLLTFLSFASSQNLCLEKTADLGQLIDQLYLASKDYPTKMEDFQNTLFLRDQILSLEPKIDIFGPENRETSMKNFLTWADKHYSMDGIEIKWNEKFGAQMIASRNLEVDEEISRIPSDKTINLMGIDRKYQCLSDVEKDWDIYDTVWASKNLYVELLAQGVKNNSFFGPYIRSFPREYAMPVDFSIEDYKLFKNSIVLESAQYCALTAFVMYAKIWKKLDSDPICAQKIEMPAEKFTLRLFLWSFNAVLSRQYNGWFRNGKSVSTEFSQMTFDHILRLCAIAPLWFLVMKVRNACRLVDGVRESIN